MYAEVNIPTFMERRDTQMLMMMFKVKNNITPSSLSELLPVEHDYNVRRENHMNNPYHAWNQLLDRLCTMQKTYGII